MRRASRRFRPALLALGAVVGALMLSEQAHATTTARVELGAAESFAVLGGTTVTSAGRSTLTGDLGVSPGTAVTGFSEGDVSGTTHTGDPEAAQAHADLSTAYGDAVGRSPATSAAVLDGMTLGPGIHGTGGAMSLAGGVTLDAGGDPGAIFLLQAGSTLTTAAGSHVDLAGGAQACNVFWQIGSSATLGASSQLRGTVLASTSVSMGDGVAVDGRILARDGAVTMINDSVAVPHCSGPLSVTAPAIAPFTTELTGRTHAARTMVGAWGLTDSRGVAAGYTVTVSAGVPTVNDSAVAAGTGARLTLTLAQPAPAAGNSETVGPVVAPSTVLAPDATTLASANPGTGLGAWEFAAETSAATGGLQATIPGDASAGTFHSTLTFTVSPLAP